MISVFDNGPFAPCPSGFNLAQYVLQHAPSQPDKTALSVVSVQQSQTYSFAQLETAVLGVAHGLLAQGLTPGDIVLMRLGNTVDFPVTYLGAIAAGLVPVPTSSQLTSAEVAKITAELSPALVVHDPQVALCDVACKVIDLQQLAAFKQGPTASYHLGDPARLAYIVYTSGTSGHPRAVMHAHRAIWARQMMHRDWYDLNADDTMLHAGAFNWTFTLGAGLLDPWSVGASSLILAPDVQISDIPALLSTHKATIFAGAPGVYRKILQSNETLDLPHLRHGIAAGEKLSERQREAWHKASGTQLHEAFGMSECSTFISGSPNAPAAPHSLGRPQNGRKVAIIGPEGPVDIGQEGVIAVHKSDPGLMLGFYGAEADTQERYHDDWFLTGDLGRMDEGYNITYLGRADDMMNAGGFRVSPIEVEAALSSHPDLTQVGVIDVEIKQDTRIIAAFYTADDDIAPKALEAFAESVLARYKQPRVYLRVAALPTNANGKLSRKKLRKIYEAAHVK